MIIAVNASAPITSMAIGVLVLVAMVRLLFAVNLSVAHAVATRLDHAVDVASNSAIHASLRIISVVIADALSCFECSQS